MSSVETNLSAVNVVGFLHEVIYKTDKLKVIFIIDCLYSFITKLARLEKFFQNIKFVLWSLF